MFGDSSLQKKKFNKTLSLIPYHMTRKDLMFKKCDIKRLNGEKCDMK